MKRIGGLWFKESQKDGKKYMSGKIKLDNGQPVDIVVFTNERKETETQPDKVIYLSEPKTQDSKVSEQKFNKNTRWD